MGKTIFLVLDLRWQIFSYLLQVYAQQPREKKPAEESTERFVYPMYGLFSLQQHLFYLFYSFAVGLASVDL